MKKVSVILLCAGEGKRLQSYSSLHPKPLVRIKALGNTPILQNNLELLLGFEVNTIFIVRGHLGDLIESFLIENPNFTKYIGDKIKIVDAGLEYKKGPLYSFLSVYKQNFLNPNEFYLILPGDTLFENQLLKEVFSYIEKVLTPVQNTCVVFFQKTMLKQFEYLKLSKVISTIALIENQNSTYVNKFEKLKISDISENKEFNLQIPIIALSYDYVKKISLHEKELEATTIIEVLNYLLSKEIPITANQIISQYHFFDIDREINLDYIEKLVKKKGNNSKLRKSI
ncbi:MAG: NTP transferase domain-containing protein [Candidatus Lokiarchaeota archaeon]|nr:NTP transferase domain-containing protein [Candidatus Lokiarchaeota archaeon]